MVMAPSAYHHIQNVTLLWAYYVSFVECLFARLKIHGQLWLNCETWIIYGLLHLLPPHKTRTVGNRTDVIAFTLSIMLECTLKEACVSFWWTLYNNSVNSVNGNNNNNRNRYDCGGNGNSSFILWLEACYKLSENSMSNAEKMIYALLSGNINVLIDVSGYMNNVNQEWHNLLWVLLRCKRVHSIYNILMRNKWYLKVI